MWRAAPSPYACVATCHWAPTSWTRRRLERDIGGKLTRLLEFKRTASSKRRSTSATNSGSALASASVSGVNASADDAANELGRVSGLLTPKAAASCFRRCSRASSPL